METLAVDTGLAFLEGIALIISPCILPILPIILSGSLRGTRLRPYGIILGFILAFAIVTLFSRSLVVYAHINSETLRNASYLILLMIGIIMMSTFLTDKFSSLTSRLSRFGSSFKTANDPEAGLISGLFFGALVGVIWTPCAGPILAAVIVQAIIQPSTFESVLVVTAFAVGAGVPMLLIALLGRSLINKVGFFKKNAILLRKALGLIIILSVIFLMYGINFPFLTAQTENQTLSANALVNGLEHPYPAPELGGIEAWINSEPLKLNELKGKVVLIDFWTYSCINCIRTLPYLKDWYAKYHDKGFEIIGIHSPEFEFEQDLDNVKNAVSKFGIAYPVALDNQFVTWRRYKNQYWPAHYLINKNGEVVYQHFGEGEYAITENNIRHLLGINSEVPQDEQDYSSSITPETYLGYTRAANFASPEKINKDEINTYSYPADLRMDQWALQGKWAIYGDKIISGSAGASIKLHFNAQDVYAVMGADKPIRVKITRAETTPNKTQKINHEQITILRNQLYTVVQLKQQTEGIVELTVLSPGLEIYTFTFGS